MAETIRVDLALSRPDFDLEVKTEVPARGVTALFGPSGAGKTTVLRCVAGLERAASGTVVVPGAVWQDSAAGVWVEPHRRAVGYVAQTPDLFTHLNVRDNLLFGLCRTPAAERRLSYEETVERLGLESLVTRRTAGLSGGQRQRVAIARALLSSPDLLLMDEPLASLDETSRKSILPYLETVFREFSLPVVYVSHSRREVMRLADRVVLLDMGRVRAEGAVEDLAVRVDLAPFGDADELGAVIEATVAGRDEPYALDRLEFDGGTLLVPGESGPVGARRRVRIRARDVSLTLERPTGTSILNVLPVRVREIADSGGVQPVVVLECGATVLLARVTRRSIDHLGVRAGTELYAQVKGVALLG